MPNEQNKSIVRRFLEDVWGRGQITALRGLVSPDIVDNDPVPGQPCGLEGQEWVTRTLLSAFSNYRLNIEHLLSEGDRVVDHWTFDATHTGDLFGIPATGKKIHFSGADETRFEGGKIAEIWHREDMLTVLQQIGQAPALQLPPSFGRPPSGANRQGGGGRPAVSEREARDNIRHAFEQMLDRGDLGSIDRFITPDFVGHYSALPPVYGEDGFREFISNYTRGLSDRHTDIEDLLIDGEYAAARVVYRSRHTGSLLGMAATGKTLAVKSLSIFRLVGDRAAEQWATNDDLGMMQQLGAVPQMFAEQPQPC